MQHHHLRLCGKTVLKSCVDNCFKWFVIGEFLFFFIFKADVSIKMKIVHFYHNVMGIFSIFCRQISEFSISYAIETAIDTTV